jgi:hypothetical protein
MQSQRVALPQVPLFESREPTGLEAKQYANVSIIVEGLNDENEPDWL